MAGVTRHLLYMLKAPIVGTVKTRLAAVMGQDKACYAYRRLVEHSLQATKGAWQQSVYYAPAEAEQSMRQWLKNVAHFAPQPEGDLGVRMMAAAADAFSRSADAVALLGGDCPYVDAALLQEAFAALVNHDVVIGPAADGGYYTLLMKAVQQRLLQGIAWGTESVLAATLQRAHEHKLSVFLLPELEDIDAWDAWQRACACYTTLAY